ncbi:uncharacterized protein PG998_012958 [Apiospora kogelbergensis]|uniref:Uncharacterized protein n=1 Tax=Apiospora kogelbergensis TaxID=1337665 RepID=A0AAW0Q342_9PEZI
MSDIESDLFAINLDDAEAGASATATDPTPAADRTGQTEEEFQAVRKAYRVKVEDGDIWKTVQLPLARPPTKLESQALLHAVEELYFFRRFEEGADFARRALGNQDVEEGSWLDADTRRLLTHYESRCRERSAEVKSS